MRTIMRYAIAAVAGICGLAAIGLVLRPNLVTAQNGWLLAAIAGLLAAALVSTALSVLETQNVVSAPPPAPADPDTEHQVQGEIGKIVNNLRGMVEASGSFNSVLTKANTELPTMLTAGQVQLVISYLMIENDNMRKRTSDLQSNLELSQRQIEKLKTNLAKAEEQGLSDGLTGLRNRRGFDITLAAEVTAARSSGKPLSLILADIDHFKLINDRYGHQTGDEVLRWFSRILAANMKGRDTVCRYGGEEFAIILPQTSAGNAVTLAGQIKQQLDDQLWTKPGAPNTNLRVTASFGVAELVGVESSGTLVNRADSKLYECKQQGRNRIAA